VISCGGGPSLYIPVAGARGVGGKKNHFVGPFDRENQEISS